MEEDKVWCPVRALKWYLDRVRSKRTASSLFVTYFAPFLRLLLDPQSFVGLSIASGKQGLMPFSPIEYMHMILGRLVLLGHCSMGQH